MLKIDIVSHIKDLTPDEKAYAIKRFNELASIDKRLEDSATQIHLELRHSGTHDNWQEFECIAHMRLPGKDVYASDKGRSINEAIDLAQAKAKRQLEKANDSNKRTELPEEDPKGESGFDDLL